MVYHLWLHLKVNTNFVSHEGCVFQETNFLGGGLPESDGGQGVEAADPEGCAEICQSNPKCSHWTFVSKWKVNCYLKNRLGEKTEFEGGVSGTFGANCGKAHPR